MNHLAIVAVGLATAIVASAEEPKPTPQVQAYCDSLDELATGDRMPIRIFADVSNGTQEGPSEWREFKTDAERTIASVLTEPWPESLLSYGPSTDGFVCCAPSPTAHPGKSCLVANEFSTWSLESLSTRSESS